MAAFVDHYAILGVNSKADSATIRKAYRQLALQYHPDKAVPGKEVDAANFINTQAAYEILVDGTKRKDYDIQYNRHYKDAHALKSAKQASRVAQVFQPETDGSYGAGYGPDEMVGDEEDEIEEDYPSDTPTDPGSDCQDTGVYEDGYADPHYKPYRTSDDVVYGSVHKYGMYTEGFDSSDPHYQFPDDLADDFSPAQGYDDEWDAESPYDHDEEKPAPRISHPLTEAFDAFDNMRKSRCLGTRGQGNTPQEP